MTGRRARSARIACAPSLALVACSLAGCSLAGCSLAGCSSRPTADSSDAGASEPPWALPSASPPPRPGMVWIPPGSLVVGTPKGVVPRVPDEEMAGEQVVMRGFHVDVYPFPNEPGALPKVGMTQAEAGEACAAQGKRLCSELELERACKGPRNTVYEYGDVYKAAACTTGDSRGPRPNGMSPLCASGFGVHDLHGGAWSWTSSPWKRDPNKAGLVAIRGGDGTPGEVVGRCANGRGVPADTKSADIGFRCCAGEPNGVEVTVSIPRGEPLSLRPPDGKLTPKLEQLAAADPSAPKSGRFTIERLWIWRPFGGEELWIGGGCSETIKSKRGKKRRAGCGIVVARDGGEAPVSLAFIGTDRWQPTMALAGSSRDLFLYGGDEHGAFRRKLTYDWGKLAIGDKARKKDGKGDVFE